MLQLIKKLGIIFGAVVLIGIAGTMLSYYTTDYNYSSKYTSKISTLKLCMNMVRSDENYDVAFIGPSTVYSGYITSIFDDKLGCNSINLGSEFQLVCDSYAVTRDYLKNNDAKYVVLEVDPGLYMGKNSYNDNEHNTTPYTLTTLKPSWDKFTFVLEMIVKRPATAFRNIKFYVNPLNIINYDKNINWERATSYYESIGMIVGPKGELLYSETINDGTLGEMEVDSDYDPSYKVEIAREYIDRITELCDEYDAELILVTQGPSDASILSNPDWEEAHRYFSDYAKENGLLYLDFAYAKESTYEKKTDSWFNAGHLSSIGAERFSTACAQVLADYKAGEDVSDLFYSDYDAYLEHVDVANAWITLNGSVLTGHCLYGMDGEPMYEFYGTYDFDEESGAAEWEILQESSYNDTLDISAYDYTTYKVVVKLDTGSQSKYSVYELAD